MLATVIGAETLIAASEKLPIGEGSGGNQPEVKAENHHATTVNWERWE